MNKSIRYPRLVHALNSKVWAITPPALQAIAGTLHAASTGQQFAGVINEPDEGKGPNLSHMKDLPPDIAIVPVHGIIGRHLSSMESACGGCDLDAVEADMRAAVEAGARAILLHVDSPGGVTDGIDSAAALVADISRTTPVYAYTDSMMCSAAYWLCAGASAIYATPFADVGSIGVYMAWTDPSKWMEREGYELKIFKAGRLKAAFLPGQMTDEAAAHLQEQIDTIYAAFTGHVTAYRPEVDPEAMQGQSFLGVQADAEFLIDGVVVDLADAISQIIQDSGFTRAL